MYMSVPSKRDVKSTEKDEQLQQFEIEVSNALKMLEGKISTEEYNKLWQELRHTGKDFDQLYEECRSSTFRFKDYYDDIKKTERLNEALRQHYYQALSTKKKHDEDRDAYFKNDKALADMKEDFIEETQKLALSNSRYVEYNQRFSVQREQYICRLLNDVNKVNDKNTKLKTDRDRLSRELGECRGSLIESRSQIEDLLKKNESLDKTCKQLDKIRANMKKEAEWMLRQNNKLKDTNSRLESEISSLKGDLDARRMEKNKQEAEIGRLLSDNKALEIRRTQLDQMVESLHGRLRRAHDDLSQKRRTWDEERNSLKNELKDFQTKLDKARTNTHKTILRNQQLREKLKSATHGAEIIEKDKLNFMLKDHRTQKTNVELTKKQMQLIDEVLELKSDFFKDKSRMKRASKENKRLEATVDDLREKIQILRKDPTAVIPIEDAQEFRDMTRQRLVQQITYSGSTVRRANSSLARVT